MQDADALGGVPVEVVLGPDLYLLGEETGLEEVIEGRPPLPRVARRSSRDCSPGPRGQPDTGQQPRDADQRAPYPGRRRRLASGQRDRGRSGHDAVHRLRGPPAGGGVRAAARLAAALPGGGVGRRPARRPGAEGDLPRRLQHRPRSGAAGRAAGLGLDAAGGVGPGERAGSRCSTTRPTWCRRPGGTRGSCRWSHAASARPASSAPARSPRPWRRSRQAPAVV